MNDKAGTKVEIARSPEPDRLRICLHYMLNNTSGTDNSYLKAAISVERLVKDVESPLVAALSPLKLTTKEAISEAQRGTKQ